jgi:hypothetical protein
VLAWREADVVNTDRPPDGGWTALFEGAGVDLRTPGSDSSQRRETWP